MRSKCLSQPDYSCVSLGKEKTLYDTWSFHCLQNLANVHERQFLMNCVPMIGTTLS